MTVGRGALSRLLAPWRGKFFIEFNRDPSASLVLCGRERTGTTWMANVINYDGAYRCIFEPFHPWEMESVRHFGVRRYIRPGSVDPVFLEPVGAVLRGDIRSAWTDSTYSQNQGLFFGRRLIKTVRANLFLRWMYDQFPKISIVLSVRHPCATVCSIMNKGWPPTLSGLVKQPKLVSDFLEPYMDLISDARTAFEKHVLSWCIEYYVVLEQFLPDELHLLFYENLVSEPEDEIARLFGFLGRDYDGSILNQVQKPSATATMESRIAIEAGENLLTRWQEELSWDQIARCIELLEAFGLDQVYSDSPMPSRAGAREFMLGSTA